MAFVVKVAVLLAVLQVFVGLGSSEVVLEMWETRCKGGWYRNDRFGTGCFSWPSAGGTSRGIQMSSGSCVAIYRQTGCWDSNGVITSLNECYPAHVYSARECTRTEASVTCPAGQIVKAMEVSASPGNGGRTIRAVSIQCGTSSGTVLKLDLSHGHDHPLATILTPSSRTECKEGIGGLVNEIDEVRDVVLTTNPVCTGADTDTQTQTQNSCPKGQAVVGLTASIEEHTELVKSISVVCGPLDVENVV